MKMKNIPALVLALGLLCATTTQAQEAGYDDPILTPSDDGEFGGLDFGDTFGEDFGAEFADVPSDSEEPSNPTENSEETGGEENTQTESSEEVVQEVRNIDSQGKINKKIVALSDKVPGAITLKGMTFLTISSQKMIGTYLPCSTTEEDTLMNAFTRLKLSQGAPVDCREDITYRMFPYRMYRKAR